MKVPACLLLLTLAGAARAETHETSTTSEPVKLDVEKFRFGLLAGFSSVDFSGLGSPDVGLKIVVTESIAILVDGGLRIPFTTGSTVGFNVGVGIQGYLRDGAPLRPYIGGRLGVSRETWSLLGFAASRGVAMDIGVGGGAEYWFSKSFSLAGQAMLAFYYYFQPQGAILTTLSPGVAATFYF